MSTIFADRKSTFVSKSPIPPAALVIPKIARALDRDTVEIRAAAPAGPVRIAVYKADGTTPVASSTANLSGSGTVGFRLEKNALVRLAERAEATSRGGPKQPRGANEPRRAGKPARIALRT